MKKLIGILIGLFLMCSFVGNIDAANLIVNVSGYERTGNNDLRASVMLTNSSNTELSFCNVTVVLLSNGAITASKSRPFVDLEPGCFVTKTFYFGKNIEFTHYKTSVSSVRFLK